MAVALFLYGWSAVVVRDVESLVVLPLVWLVLFVLSLRWFTARPHWSFATPFVAVGVWFLAMLT